MTKLAKMTVEDLDRRIDQAEKKFRELEPKRQRVETELAAIETKVTAALAALQLDEGDQATVTKLEAERAGLEKDKRGLVAAQAALTARLSQMSRERTELIHARQQEQLEVELGTLDTLSTDLQKQGIAFAAGCSRWASQMIAVMRLGGESGSRRPGTMIAESLYALFRGTCPEVSESLRHHVSVPSAARSFSDWTRRSKVRGQKNVKAAHASET